MIKKLLVFFFITVVKFSEAQTDIVVQSGHTESVNVIAYSHNGKYLLTGGNDNTIILWDFKSGMQVRSYLGHSKGLTCLAFAPNDSQFVSGSYDQTLKIWDTYTGRCMNTIDGYGYAFTQVEVNKNGRFMAATNRDKTFSLWDLRTATPVFHFFQSVANYGDMADVCFDTCGNIYFATWDGTIFMKDVMKDSDYSRFDTILLPSEFGHLNSLEVTMDGKYFIGGCDGTAQTMGDFFIIEKATHKIVYRNQNYIGSMGAYSQAISVSADSKYVAYCTDTDGVHIINLLDFSTEFKFPVKRCTVIKFSQGGLFLSCAENNMVTEYNVRIGTALHEYKGFTKAVRKLQLSSDGKITSYHDNALIVWDLQTAKAEPIAESISNTSENKFALNYDRTKIAYEKNEKIYIYDIQRKANTKVLSNFNEWPRDFLFSHDGNYFAVTGNQEILYNTTTYARTRVTAPLTYGFITTQYFSPDNKLFLTQSFGSDEFSIWDIEAKKKSVITYSANDIGPFSVSKKYIAAIIKDRLGISQSAFLEDVKNAYDKDTARVAEDKDFLYSSASLDAPKYIVVWDRGTQRIVNALKLPSNNKDSYTATPDITALDFDSTGAYIAMASNDNLIRIWNVETGEITKQMQAHHAEVTSISYTKGNKYLISSSTDGSIIVWDGETYEQLATMILIGLEDYIIVTPENYYTCSKNGIKALAFRKENMMYPFSQFDLKFNRPDKVLESLKSENLELINALKAAYEKRLQKVGIKEENMNEEIHAPEVAIENIYEIPLNAVSPNASFIVTARDDKSKIKSINISINDVPQCNSYKIDAKNDDANYIEKNIEIKLMNGRNEIVVTCMNQLGVESLPVTLEINYTEEKQGEVYFIGIAVADYKDSDYNLKYTVKDIRDLAKAFKQKYPSIHVDTLLNADVTRENILKLRQKLITTNVNDLVVMAISGHGLLSKQLDFYFATYDVDFKNPEIGGIKYEAVESLYDCIAARKKLLLLDACHSGEVDREGNLKVVDILPSGVTERRTKGSQLLEGQDKISLHNSFELMQDIFTNLSKGNGSIVISAAGGQEYALESDQWSNGVFTYCVLQALLYNKADANNNKETTISELKKYVSAEVVRLTAGKQKPTSRRENLLFDWKVW